LQNLTFILARAAREVLRKGDWTADCRNVFIFDRY